MPKDEREFLTKDKHFIIPDIMEEARMFEWAGVNFGEEETYKLTKSIKVSESVNISLLTITYTEISNNKWGKFIKILGENFWYN